MSEIFFHSWSTRTRMPPVLVSGQIISKHLISLDKNFFCHCSTRESISGHKPFPKLVGEGCLLFITGMEKI